MAFNMTKPISALISLHDVTRESVAAMTNHCVDAFVRKNVARVYDLRRRYDVWKFDAEAIV